jgi:hypothetical protein
MDGAMRCITCNVRNEVDSALRGLFGRGDVREQSTSIALCAFGPGSLLVSSRADAESVPSITARPSPAEKAQFVSVAVARGLTESALALKAIRTYLSFAPVASNTRPDARTRATDRITIRLRPGDGGWVARRAAERGIKSSAYIAALVRAHVSRHPPLPEDEVRTLKRAVSVLAEMGRILNNKSSTQFTRDDLQHTRGAVAAVEKQLQDFAKASLIAWESRVE